MAKNKGTGYEVQWSPKKGGLQSDLDPKNMADGGLYVTDAETGGLNIRAVGKGTNVSPDYEPVYGNNYAYQLDEVVPQSKIWRIYADTTNFTSGSTTAYFTLETPTGTVFFDAATTPIIINFAPIADVLAILGAWLEMFVSVSPAGDLQISYTTTVETATTGYVDFTFGAAPYFDYIFDLQTIDEGLILSYDVIQEAIDVSMVGEWNDIGSDDRTGDCFQHWTTRIGLEEELTIANITNPAGTTVRVETATDHGLSTGYAVRIKDVTGTVEANGIWVITVQSATTFDLDLCVYANVYTGSGVVVYNIYGLGEIGVAVRNDDNSLTYTRLLRSREFNFTTLHQIDCRVKRKQDQKKADYFTDNFNPPRVFYYKGAYITDGALAFSNPDGLYAYGSIDDELKWILSNEGFYINFVTQINTGGGVLSGNWVYTARFLSDNLAPSEYILPTGFIPVYSANPDDTPFITGDQENYVTGKINTLSITNPLPGVFKYVELAGINYVGGAVQGYTIGRYLLDGNSIQLINHTGNEAAVTDLDIGLINLPGPKFYLAQNVELLDNRAILSNLTPAAIPDLQAITETMRYSLERQELNSVLVRTFTVPDGDNQDPIGVPRPLAVGEYQKPENVCNYLSHMIMEKYRYGFMYRIRQTGQLTQVFYPGYDITIDLPAVLPAERDAGSFTSFDLTDGNGSDATVAYSIYIDFHGLDLDEKIDGVAFRDLVSEIIPVRAEVIPEVFAQGVGIPAVDGNLTDGPAEMFFGSGSTVMYGPWPHPMGTYLFSLSYTLIASSDSPTYPDLWADEPTSVYFYSPDVLFGHTAITLQNGDALYNFGSGYRQYNTRTSSSQPPDPWPGVYAEFNGHTNLTVNTDIEVLDINDLVVASKGQETIVVNGIDHSLQMFWDENYSAPNSTNTYPYEKAVVMTLDQPATDVNLSGNANYGCYNMLYYRPITDKYGDPTTTRYVYAGTIYQVGANTGVIPTGDIKVFGDCFTQKSYLKLRYATGGGYGMGGGIAYYSQNRINAQMHRPQTPTTTPAIFPEYFMQDWLEIYIDGTDPQINFYNEGYTPNYTITNYVPYDPNGNYQADWGNAITWSEAEVEGSETDNLRVFLPLNFKFLDYTQGSITDAKSVNGELVTIQPGGVQRHYFNTTATLTTQQGAEVILGSGSVLQNRGIILTLFGSKHKWSIVIGKSDKGHEVLYGLDIINKTIWRIGYDGTVSLDEVNGLKAFLANNLQWVVGKDNPAHDEGVCAVPNQRFREVMWTFRGRQPDVQVWSSVTTYSIGDVVQYTPSTFTTFEQTGEFYQAIEGSTNLQPDLNPNEWEVIPHTDPDYYTEYTLVLSESKNQFQAFHTPKPKIYNKFNDGYLVPRPVSNTGQIYDGNGDTILMWFNDGSTYQRGSAYFDAVINAPQGRKKYNAIRIESDVVPVQINVTTNQQTTYMNASEFEQREGNEFDVPVMNDATITATNPGGLPNINTSNLWGDYAIVRVIMSTGNYYNKVNSFWMKLKTRAREYFR